MVAHVFLIRSGSILLLRRCNTGFEDGKYGLPGGHIEEQETVRQTAVRECREEIGIEIEESDLSVIGVSHYTSPDGDGIDVFLCADRWANGPRVVAECDELRWCQIGSLPEETIPFIRRATNHHLSAGHWFDEIGWATGPSD